MTVSISLFNALGRIAAGVASDIRLGIEDGLAAFSRHWPVEKIDIAVHPSTFVAKETGMSGMAFGPENCAIYVDPLNAALPVETRAKAAAMTVHEIHHVLRMRHFSIERSEDWSAGEVLALEGLATQTEIFLGYPEPTTIQNVDETKVRRLLARLATIIDEPKADWGWINQPSGLPSQIYRAAYPMGHHLVGSYLARSSRDPIQGLTTSWREIWSFGMR